MLKTLRIAVTALSLTACVLLIALWVRSYYWVYLITGGISHDFYLQSLGGQIGLYALVHVPPSWQFASYELTTDLPQHQGDSTWALTKDVTGNWHVIIPYWFPVIVSAALAAIPWIHWSNRFSLRTLLIATTLAAVMLGLVVISHLGHFGRFSAEGVSCVPKQAATSVPTSPPTSAAKL